MFYVLCFMFCELCGRVGRVGRVGLFLWLWSNVCCVCGAVCVVCGGVLFENVLNVCMCIFVGLLLYGDVAQMVERSLSMREVLGSIPSFSRRM